MKQKLIDKVKESGTVDTNRFRYKYNGSDKTIRKTPLNMLYTRQPISEWEVAHKF